MRVLYPDQLSQAISSLKDLVPEQDTLLLCETSDWFTTVKHHKMKLVFILSAMRHFADELKQKKFPLKYIELDDPHNSGTIVAEIERHITSDIRRVVITEPSEYHSFVALKDLQSRLSIPLEIREDDRFLSTHEEFTDWAKSRKELRMEFFYRKMRLKYNILIKDGIPEGGRWNYDSLNRKFPKNSIQIPQNFRVDSDAITDEVIDLVKKKFSDHFGEIEPFCYGVTHNQAKKALSLFIQDRLQYFGDYQDAMLQNEPWMFHSHLSGYINIGLLDPLECIRAVEKAYYSHQVSLNASEGFIRQILGWREYIRGIYWLKMPAYQGSNYLGAKRPLPDFYWTGDTKLNCLKQCVRETKQHAYAHHIQRLMVLGNFALLTGIDPRYINEWYWIVYIDAYHWVELPNVIGMILYADGGLLGSKPYAASGAYINKMSNYCKSCTYNVSLKNGVNSCPFNYLYWNFLIQHEDKFKKNPRLNMVYSQLQKMEKDRIKAIKRDSEQFLQKLPFYEDQKKSEKS